jgi:aquaporin Z
VNDALRRHWPEFLMEALGLALFMVSACLFVALVEHPASPLHRAVDNALLRRLLIGVAMGATALALIHSPWGRQSGAHLNPAVTLTFWRLGRIEAADAAWYVLAQFAGGVAGVAAAGWLLGPRVIADPTVNHVVTMPGTAGAAAAFAAEALMSFGLMTVVLRVGNRRDLNRYTGLAAALLVAVYITVEAPISGMSMNPARSFGSALPAMQWRGLWIYFTAPLAGMLIAAEAFLRSRGPDAVLCCKLHHDNDRRCIFRCRWAGAAIEAHPGAGAATAGGDTRGVARAATD